MIQDLPPPEPVVETVTVVAPRMGPSRADGAFSVVRIDQAIATAPRLDVALTAVPGVQLFRRSSSASANPTTQGLSVRSIAGSGAGRALVTLDGVPQNDPFGGWVIWSGLQPETIQSASIIRGAGSGPYGAGALTGVVQLTERRKGGVLEAAVGERGYTQLSGVDVLGDLMIAGSWQQSDGWIPVRAGRGAADRPLAYEAASGVIRYSPSIGSTDLAFRAAAFEEQRDSGLAGAASRATGAVFSATAIGGEANGRQWRLQAWSRVSDLENSSFSVAPDRSTTTPAAEQFGTPASGLGFNAALRNEQGSLGWELGLDARRADGETRERFRYMAGSFTRGRIAGGTPTVAGVYAEGWRDLAPDLLLAGGLRLDHWSSTDGRRRERDLTTGAPTLTLSPPDADGWQPTGRIALVRSGEIVTLRGAAYAGFRPPTLNELHRPFRVGNDVTEANAALEPEVLYGTEFGVAATLGGWRLDGTVFTTRLDKAIANVTIGSGPGSFPVAGFIPAGGVLRQRQNAGVVDAWGIEAGAIYAFTVEGRDGRLTVSAGYTDAEVDGGSAASQLTGLRPAQTPRLTASANLVWPVLDSLVVGVAARYEGDRFEDDLNSRKLAPATTIDLRADWSLTPRITVWGALDNAFDEAVETGETATGIESFDAPRTLRIGLRMTLSGS
jgi:vitamin B12 transporter